MSDEYTEELREALKEARRIARQAELETSVFQRQAKYYKDELEKHKGPPPAPDVRSLSNEDYRRAKSDAMRAIMRQERARKEAATLPDLKGVDVKKMSREEYAMLKAKLIRRG